MPVKTRLKLTLTLFFFIIVFVYFFIDIQIPSFEHFSYLCRIYEREGILIEKMHSYVSCDYHSSGKSIASNPFRAELVMNDVHDKIIWKSHEYAHHDLKFSPDENSFLVTTSEIIKLNNLSVRSDCFSKRDLENKILASWCVKDNITDLEKMGFEFKPKKFINTFTSENVDYEISHANSIYEIQENELSKSNPALQAGNYIINLYGPSKAVLIISADMKKILWTLDMSQFYYQNNLYLVQSHDWQVLPNGNILAYLNLMRPLTNNVTSTSYLDNSLVVNLSILYDYKFNSESWMHSSLAEIDPNTKKIVWIFKDNPASNFYQTRSGTVSKLKNSYVYTNLEKGGQMVEIDFYSHKVWQYTAREIDLKGQPRALVFTKPLLHNQYLIEKGLLHESLLPNFPVKFGFDGFGLFN